MCTSLLFEELMVHRINTLGTRFSSADMCLAILQIFSIFSAMTPHLAALSSS